MSGAAYLDLPHVKQARGDVELPGSKSISNRVLLLSALALGAQAKSNTVPRMPMVAVAVRTFTMDGLLLPTKPVAKRRPPLSSSMNMLLGSPFGSGS